MPEAYKDEPTKQGEKLTEKAMKWNYGIEPSIKPLLAMTITGFVYSLRHSAYERSASN